MLDEFSADLEAFQSPHSEAALRIAAPGNLIQYMLVPMLSVLQDRHPHLTVHLRQAAHGELVKMAATGKVDVAIDRSPAHPSLVTVARMNEQLHLVAPAGHELLSICPKDRPAAIGKYPFASYTVGLRTRDLIQRWAAKVGAAIVPQVESRSVPALKAAVLEHGVLSILPVLAVRDEVRAGKLSLVEIADMPLRRVAVVTTKPGDEHSPKVRSFVDELIDLSTRNPDSFTVEVRRAVSR
jgi:DNA-binding transcriptional LysR family regulator